MDPWHVDDQATIYHGDCLEVLRELPDASVDSVVTDPPYALGFMGREWDSFGGVKGITDPAIRKAQQEKWGTAFGASARPAKPAEGEMLRFQLWSQEWAAECLRVLKPGGHLLAFGGTRTWHRLAVAIEDAGFEIRDSIAWMYGSGFPKSLDVSKAIDKRRDDWADILRVTAEIARLRDEAGLTNRDLDDAFGFAGMAGHWTSTKSQPTVPRVEQWAVLRDMLNPEQWLDDEVWRLNGRKGEPGEAWGQRPVVGAKRSSLGGTVAAGERNAHYINKHKHLMVDITAPATPDAARWQGWGTALKPAHEPIVVARKPLTGTVAGNVLEHGTGALNIDGCRIGTEAVQVNTYNGRGPFGDSQVGQDYGSKVVAGRWPANVVLDEDQAASLDKQSGVAAPKPQRTGRVGGNHDNGTMRGPAAGSKNPAEHVGTWPADPGGGASRFFYVAKAPARERPKVDGVAHPTVKPLTLMRWLCRLVTPPGGVVLEPFAGSGTTIEAALMEGFRVVAIEREPDYLPLIAARLERVNQEPEDGQLTFDASA